MTLQEWASQAEDGVCGPYDQPVTKRGGKVYVQP